MKQSVGSDSIASGRGYFDCERDPLFSVCQLASRGDAHCFRGAATLESRIYD